MIGVRMTVAAACLIAIQIPAWAEDCSDLPTQMDMTLCAGRAYEAADAELNTLYGRIKTALAASPEIRDRLVAAQRAWVSFRDAECTFTAAGVEGGSIQPMIIAQCRTGLTESRIVDFKRYLSCEEGDPACPVPLP